ncbi:MAG: dTDP-glucose 4,6-dehydratase [Patescibacteria group bacterium]
MKNIIIFGGAGFIGSHFMRYWRALYPESEIIIYDALTYSGDLTRLSDYFDPSTGESKDSRVCFIRGDVADRAHVEEIIALKKPEYVINFAAETHVDRSIHVGAEEFIRSNVTGVFNILEAVKKYGCTKYLQVSTDEVYGQLPLDKKELKFTEQTQYQPNVPYSATKASGDLLCNAYYFTWGLPVVVTHCSNNYGEWQYPEKLIPYLTNRLLENKSAPIYGDGENVRDWIYVGDHVEVLARVLVDGKPGEVYNIGADNELNNLTIVQMLIEQIVPGVDWKSKIEFVADRPGHDRRYAIDASKIERDFGWHARFGASEFPAKLAETVEWYRKNKDWSRAVSEKTGVVNAHIDLWHGVMGKDIK